MTGRASHRSAALSADGQTGGPNAFHDTDARADRLVGGSIGQRDNDFHSGLLNPRPAKSRPYETPSLAWILELEVVCSDLSF